MEKIIALKTKVSEKNEHVFQIDLIQSNSYVSFKLKMLSF